MTEMPTEKRCPRCATVKSASDFYKAKSRKDGLDGVCSECRRSMAISNYHKDVEGHRSKNRSRAADLRDYHKARAEVWREAHRDHIKEYSKRKYWEDVEASRAKGRSTHARNKEVENARARRYHAENIDKLRPTRQAWTKANMQVAIEYTRRRRVRIKGSSVEPFDVRVIYRRDRFLCHICGTDIQPSEVSLDHLIPVSLGGPHTYWNVSAAHRRCNSRRGAGRLPAQIHLPLPLGDLEDYTCV